MFKKLRLKWDLTVKWWDCGLEIGLKDQKLVCGQLCSSGCGCFRGKTCGKKVISEKLKNLKLV